MQPLKMAAARGAGIVAVCDTESPRRSVLSEGHSR
jgi:hypothetical protein